MIISWHSKNGSSVNPSPVLHPTLFITPIMDSEIIFCGFLRLIGCAVPTWLPRGTAIGNRVLKPVYNIFYKNSFQTIYIWNGICISINPSECVDGNLYFSPQLFDVAERNAIERLLPASGVFLDIGANVGPYTLWAAKILNSAGKVLAIEADPKNFAQLEKNIALNKWIKPLILTENVGVSDKCEELPFYRNKHANSGANTFHPLADGEASENLPLLPLVDLLTRNNIKHIDFLKIDIEGFEFRVLSGFFNDPRIQGNLSIMPSYLLIEINEGPRARDKDYRNSLMDLLSSNGYDVIMTGKNTLFKKS